MKSKIRRSLVKTLTWRILATTDTFLISWIITGYLTLAGAIAGVEGITRCFYTMLTKEVGAKLNGDMLDQKNIHISFHLQKTGNP